ncbi:MAG: hypothetical protein ACRD0S_11850, partial [Acidimicrobiales bacterium]
GKDHLGLLIVLSLTVAAACKWLSDLTAGERHGGEFDIPLVNWVAWFLFLVAGGLALMLLVAGGARVLGRLRARHG